MRQVLRKQSASFSRMVILSFFLLTGITLSAQTCITDCCQNIDPQGFENFSYGPLLNGPGSWIREYGDPSIIEFACEGSHALSFFGNGLIGQGADYNQPVFAPPLIPVLIADQTYCISFCYNNLNGNSLDPGFQEGRIKVRATNSPQSGHSCSGDCDEMFLTPLIGEGNAMCAEFSYTSPKDYTSIIFSGENNYFVDDGANQVEMYIDNVCISQPPPPCVASFEYEELDCGELCLFNASVGDDLFYIWSLDGLVFSSDEDPCTIVLDAGLHSVCLEIVNVAGTCSEKVCQEIFIELINCPPSDTICVEDFEGHMLAGPSNQVGNWRAFSGDVAFIIDGSTNGTQVLQGIDGSGGSWMSNIVDFEDDWTTLGCEICFDIRYDPRFNNNNPTGTRAIFLFNNAVNPANGYPTSNGANYASFEVVTPIGNNWTQVCAPIALAAGANLPSNSYGQWKASSATDWDLIIQNVDGIGFPLDFAGGGNPSEEVFVDNICYKQCEPNEFFCDEKCSTPSIDISTGYNSITGQLGAPGSYDNGWILTQSPISGISVPRPAYIVNAISSWDNLTGSEYISAFPVASLQQNNPVPDTPYRFQQCFCVCDEGEVTIDLSAYVDNNVNIDLYDDLGNFIQDLLDITDTTTGAFQSPPTVSSTVVNLAAGEYCIYADVRNLSGSAMGLSIDGTISGDNIYKAACCTNGGSITGVKYHDMECDGIQDAGDVALAGWTIELYNTSYALIASAVTDASGFYSFVNVPPGLYLMREVNQPDWIQSDPSSVFSYVFVTLGEVTVQDYGNCNDKECGWSVATCYARPGSGGDVGVLFDTRYNSQAPVGGDWSTIPIGATHPVGWDVDNIGQIFGIAIDKQNSIYLAHTDVYAYDATLRGSAFGPAGEGGIYRCLAPTFAPVPYITLPNSGNVGTNKGNGIGNIAYNEVHNKLYATNLEDGKIYQIDAGLATPPPPVPYDPFVVDNGVPGLAPTDELIWGIGVYTETSGATRIYFARGRTAAGNNEIWSVATDASGFIVPGPPTLEIAQVPGTQNKLTDIAFARDGRMMVAERGAYHDSRIFEYEKIAGIWTSRNSYVVGRSNGRNSAGGVDYGNEELNGDIRYGCDSLIWATGNYMETANTPGYVYGMQGISSQGNSNPSSFNTDLYVDFAAGNDKGGIGDVELFKCPCLEPVTFPCDSVCIVIDSLDYNPVCFDPDLVDPSAICLTVIDFVCGCDGETYNNSCEAAREGILSWTPGECNGMEPQDSTGCWYEIDIFEKGFELGKIEVEILTPDVIFNNAFINENYNFGNAPFGNEITLIPPEIDPVEPDTSGFQFCLGGIEDSSQYPQCVVVKYYVPGQNPELPVLACTDTLKFYCENPEVGDSCLVIKEEELKCDPEKPEQYCYDFKVTNLSNSIVKQIVLHSTDPNINFISCNPPPFATPMPVHAINLAQDLLPGECSDLLCVKIVTTVPILDPTAFCFEIGMFNEEACCTSPYEHCVELEPCCDPCADRDFIVHDTDPAACCYTIDIINECDINFFTKVEIVSTSLGVQIGSHFTGGATPGDWSNPKTTNQCVQWKHNSCYIPKGTTAGLINFCLDDIDPGEIPQNITLNWYTENQFGEDSIACSDLFVSECVPEIDTTCIEIIDVTPKGDLCGNGSCYDDPFCLPWLRTLMQQSNNNGCQPILDYAEFRKGLWNGQPVIIGFINGAPDGGSQVIFNCQGIVLQKCTQAIGEVCDPDLGIDIGTDIVSMATFWTCGTAIPPISPLCNTGNTYLDYCVTFKNNSYPQHFADELIIIPIDPSVQLYPPIVIIPGGLNFCDTTTLDLTLHGNISPGDTAKFAIRLHDSTNPDDWCCFESDTLCLIIPPCDTIPMDCCDDYDLDRLCQEMDDVLQSIVIDNCNVCIDTSFFGDCVTTALTWGDGTTTSTIDNGLLCHDYLAGAYQLCISSTVHDSSGEVCVEKVECIEIDVDCPPPPTCCDDYDLDRLCQEMDDVLQSIIIDSCHVCIDTTFFGDCVTRAVTWGDGNTTSTIDNGLLCHDYITSGTYQICLSTFVFDDMGAVCLSKDECVEVTVDCDIPTPSCDPCVGGLISNPGYDQNAIGGNLGGPGNSDLWSNVSGSAQVIVDDACEGTTSMQMWGNRDVGEAVENSSYNIIAGNCYDLRFCARFVPQNLPTGYIRFGFYACNGPSTGFDCPNCVLIGLSSQITDSEWDCYSLPTWTATANFSHFKVKGTNDVPDNGTNNTVSWGRVDDICFTETVCALDCCIDNDDFCDLVDQGFDVFSDCQTEMTCITPKALTDCDILSIDWGDGSGTNGQGNQTECHMYSAPGTYQVCVTIERFPTAGGPACLSKEVCFDVVAPDCTCDNLDISHTPSAGLPNQCCYTIDLSNNYSSTLIKGIKIDVTPSTIIKNISALNGWNLDAYTANSAELSPPGSVLPLGNFSQVVEICTDNFTTNPHNVKVSWLVSSGTNCIELCPEDLEFECGIPPDDRCVLVVQDSIDCENEMYCFKVTNNSIPSFTINQVVLTNISPLGVLLNPNPISIPPLTAGQTSDWICTEYSGLNLVDTLCFNIVGHDRDPQGNYLTCCTDTVEHCVYLDCPKPLDCDSLLIDVSNITVGDSCCFSVDINNGYLPDHFIGIHMEVTSPGVYFANVAAQLPDWDLIHLASDEYIYHYDNPLFNGIPIGPHNLGSYCLSENSVGTEMVTFSWISLDINGDTIYSCIQTETSMCDFMDDRPCVDVSNETAFCDNDQTFVSFDITNNTHLLNGGGTGYDILSYNISLISTSGNATFNPIAGSLSGNTPFPLPPGQTTDQAVVHEVLNGVPGEVICFGVTAHDDDIPNHFLNCCTTDTTWCVTLPDCGPSPTVCDSLWVDVSSGSVSDCCFTLDLHNQYGAGQIHSFKLSTPDSNFDIIGSDTQDFEVVDPTDSTCVKWKHQTDPFIPIGESKGAVTFCLENVAITPQVVYLSWEDDMGNFICGDSLELNCPVIDPCDVSQIIIPNGLSPDNGDLLNQKLVLINPNDCQELDVTIYNRWGQAIWEMRDYDNSWEGTGMNGNPLPDGTYFVLLTFRDNEDSESVISTWLDLRRE